MPSKGKMVCGCGYKQNEATITEKKKEKKSLEIVEGNQGEKINPEIDADCAKCGHGKAYFWLMQTRASDEPETRFFKCVKCGHQWREYE